ncbi:MAG TPA: YdcF family protein, partial [Cyclobacteriaceae bacterium]
LVIVLIVFILSFLIRKEKWKKIFFWGAFSLLIFFTNDFIANEAMNAWEIGPTPYAEIKSTYEWGIVLTGVTSMDRKPDDRVYFNHGADRVVHTVELYKKGIIKNILISGGSGKLVPTGRREADEIYKAMLLMGVPADAMMLESESRNTHESAVMVKDLISDQQTHLLITSAFHLRRSVACFKKVGLKVDMFSTDFYTHPRYFTPDVLLIPRLEAMMIWQRLFKEWTGMVAYRLAGYI